MKIKKFENYISVNGEPNYVGDLGYEDELKSQHSTPTPIWVTKTGQKIPVPKLTDDHLKNIFNLLLKNKFQKLDSEKRREWSHILLDEILDRGLSI